MPIAGAAVTPLDRGNSEALAEKLSAMDGVEVRGVTGEGIAIVMEAPDSGRLKRISEEIAAWPEVMEFTLAYLNFEDEVDR